MITEIEVVPYLYIETMIKLGKLTKSSNNFISIRDFPKCKVTSNILEICEEISTDNKLLLWFSDVEYKINWTTLEFSDEMAVQVKEFVDRIQARPNPEKLYCNCEAGISRSGAIGSWIAEYLPTLDYNDFRARHSWIRPNNCVLRKLQWLSKYPEQLD
jgi:predicted protein tyrosine phosphatase